MLLLNLHTFFLIVIFIFNIILKGLRELIL